MGPLEWPEPVPRLERQQSVGVLARRSRRRRARRPPAWLTLRGWLPGPEDMFDPPPDPITQPELWDGGGCGDSDDPLLLEFLRACTPHLEWLSAELRVTPLLNGLPCLWIVSSTQLRISACLRQPTNSLRQSRA